MSSIREITASHQVTSVKERMANASPEERARREVFVHTPLSVDAYNKLVREGARLQPTAQGVRVRW